MCTFTYTHACMHAHICNIMHKLYCVHACVPLNLLCNKSKNHMLALSLPLVFFLILFLRGPLI